MIEKTVPIPLKCSPALNSRVHELPYCKGVAWNLPAPLSTLMLPAICRTIRSASIASVFLKGLSGSVLDDLTSNYTWSNIKTADGNETVYAVISTPLGLSTALAGQRVYLEISDGIETWISEVMTVMLDSELAYQAGHEKCKFVKLVWSANCRVGRLPDTWEQFIFIDTYVGQPRPEAEIEESNDGNNTPVASFGRSMFIYTFEAVMPKFVLQALSLLAIVARPQFGTVTIIDQWGSNQQINEFDISVSEWLGDGCVARVKCEFKIELASIRKLCCEDGFPNTNCLIYDFQAQAQIDQGGAEYSGFYWNKTGIGNVPFEVGQYAVVKNGSVYTLNTFNGTGWTVTPINVTDNVYVRREDKWFYARTDLKLYTKPVITSHTVASGVWTFKGLSFKGSVIQLYGQTSTSNCQLMPLSQPTGVQVFKSTGIAVQQGTVYSIWASATTVNCAMGDSASYDTGELSPC
jgi:hypothetical protein